ncbi:hypothetical protein SORDD17_01067 [Streptococcus oralis]|uniref:Lipoprotein n=1 Tax=Streptococcus oralis TaxID=1303 RepID=A0A139RL25_STROR|nr:hypothetical protein [Streptococcus oralis]KXU15459.1 hypothetical protein SORDD17_01067 [Streptococcus oralis]
MKKTKKMIGLGLAFMAVASLSACSSLTSKTSSESKESQTETRASSSEKKGLFSSVKEKLASSDFNPQDVTDETIESIKTYEDYLTMYEKILQDYYDQAEKVLNEKGIEDRSSFEELKASTSKDIEEAKKEYGPLKKAPLQGKETYVEVLKEMRNDLKDYVDQIAAS